MIIEAILIGLLIAFITGGRLYYLGDIELKGSLLVLFGVLIQLVAIIFGNTDFFKPVANYLQFFGLFLLIIAILLNLKIKGMKIILLGSLLNIVAFIAGDFMMPVSEAALTGSALSGFLETVIDGEVINYILASDAASWSKFLGKIIVMPSWYPIHHMLSIGDIILSLGIIRLIYGETHLKLFKRSGRMVRYSYNSRF